MDSALLGEMLEALGGLASEGTLRALVFSTTSRRALCAGADVNEPLDHAGGVARMGLFARLYAAVEAFPVPTLAVCVGHCVGAGAELAAGCDLRVGGDNLKLTWAGARMGVPVGPARLVPLVGLGAAKDLILTGRTVGMEEARALGLLQRTATAAQADAVALALAEEVAAHPPEGLRSLKGLFRALDQGPVRVAQENAALMDAQRAGTGLRSPPVTGSAPPAE